MSETKQPGHVEAKVSQTSSARRVPEPEGTNWHVERFGSAGPALLLLHGTGATTHSWRNLIPRLEPQFQILSLDLPGHGRTRQAVGFSPSLPNISRAIGALLKRQGFAPDIAVGHSAGAAICISMTLMGQIAPQLLISFNGALLPFRGPASRIFPAMARILYLNPATERFFAWRAGNPQTVARLIRDTGSTLEAEGLQHYHRLFRDPRHLRGALSMMAHWDLHSFARELSHLEVPLLLVAAERDRAVPPSSAVRVAKLVSGARVHRLSGLGHLAHEEDPALAADLITETAREAGLLRRQ